MLDESPFLGTIKSPLQPNNEHDLMVQSIILLLKRSPWLKFYN